jgi:predicted phage-related endonuclease
MIRTFKAGSIEWLDARTHYVTGTEMSCLFGLDRYKSAAKVLKDKITPPTKIDNQYMKKGRLLEPSVFIALTEIGIPTTPSYMSKSFVDTTITMKMLQNNPSGFVVMHTNEEARISASLDGVAYIKGSEYIVEAKTTGAAKFEAWETAPPIGYLIQVQTQLECTNTGTAILACLNSENILELSVWKVLRNKEIGNLIVETATRFWQNYKDECRFVVNKRDKLFIEENIFTNIKKIY